MIFEFYRYAAASIEFVGSLACSSCKTCNPNLKLHRSPDRQRAADKSCRGSAKQKL